MPNENIREFVERLRSEPTPAEAMFKPEIETLDAAWVFQQPIRLGEGRWAIMDFYHPNACLCVEIDGNVHASEEAQSKDWKRSEALALRGVKVIRYCNDEVCFETDRVLVEIARETRRRLGRQLLPVPKLSKAQKAKQKAEKLEAKDRRKGVDKAKQREAAKATEKATADRKKRRKKYKPDESKKRRAERRAAKDVYLASRQDLTIPARRRIGTVDGVPVYSAPPEAPPLVSRFTLNATDLCAHDLPSYSCGWCK